MDETSPDASNINILALLFLMAMCFVILQSTRKNAVRAVLATAALVPLGQRIVVGGLHLHFLRILILAGLARLVTRREYDGFKLAKLDKLFLAWVFVGFVCGLSREPSAETFGQVYNDLGVYFLLRILMHNMEGPLSDFKFYAVLGIVIGACMLVEEFTHRNPFFVFGGVPQLTVQRGDRFRCQGPFRHMILAGTFGATLFPLMIGLWRTGGRSRLLAAIGIVCSFIITVASASSGPVLTLLAAFIGIGLWPMRKHMRLFRIGLVLIMVGFTIFMNAPVWFLIAKMSDLVGGGGWHRSYLIDQFVKHFNEWWLNGTSYTAHWAPSGEVLTVNPKMMDITNHYVAQGIQGGILRLGIFIATITNCFSIVGRAVRKQFGPSYDPRVAWSLGVTLACHCTAFLSVFYFDQTLVFWFWLLAAIASIPVQAAAFDADEDSMEEEAVADMDESMTESAEPIEREEEKQGEESVPLRRSHALRDRARMALNLVCKRAKELLSYEPGRVNTCSISDRSCRSV
jgi:hypothetical protein